MHIPLICKTKHPKWNNIQHSELYIIFYDISVFYFTNLLLRFIFPPISKVYLPMAKSDAVEVVMLCVVLIIEKNIVSRILPISGLLSERA